MEELTVSKKKLENENRGLIEQNLLLQTRVDDTEKKLMEKDKAYQEQLNQYKGPLKASTEITQLEENNFALSSTVEEQEQKLKLAQVEISSRDAKIEHLRAENNAAREAARVSEETASKFKSSIEILNAKIVKLMHEKEEIQEELDELNRKRDHEFANYQKKLSSLELQIQTKENEIVWLKNSLQNAENLLRGSSNPENSQLLEHLTHECQSKQITIEELTDELNTYKQTNTSLKLKMASLEQNAVTKDDYNLIIKENQKLKDVYYAYETLKTNYDDIIKQLEKAQNSRQEFYTKYDKETETLQKTIEELGEENRQLLKTKVVLAKKYKGQKHQLDELQEKYNKIVEELKVLIHDKEKSLLDLKTSIVELLKLYSSIEESQLRIETIENTTINSKVFDGLTFNNDNDKNMVKNQPATDWFERHNTGENGGRFSFENAKPKMEEKGVQTYEEILKITEPITKPVYSKPQSVSKNSNAQYMQNLHPQASVNKRYKIVTIDGRQEKVPISDTEYNKLIQLPETNQNANYNNRTLKKSGNGLSETKNPRYSSHNMQGIRKPEESAKQCDRFHCYCNTRQNCDLTNINIWKDHLNSISPYFYMNH